MDHKESTIRGDREMSASMLKEKIMELEDKVSLDQKDLGNLLNDNSKKNEKEEKIKKSAIERLRIRIKSYKRDIDKYEVEYHKKYAISMACIVFILIGAPLGSIPKKGGTSIGIAIAIGIILFYYICLIAGEDLSDRGKVSPMLSMWIPNFLMSFVGIVLLRALTRGKITFPTDKIFEKIEKYRKK
jgi:lipopolysaccharide export system permease protein